MAGKGAQKEENHQVALSGIISHLTAKCGGNVHDKGFVEITASSVHSHPSYNFAPQNAAEFGDFSCFFSQNEPGQWISWDFKALRIEPTHYTIRTYDSGPNDPHLKR
jgi:hypothetical protein